MALELPPTLDAIKDLSIVEDLLGEGTWSVRKRLRVDVDDNGSACARDVGAPNCTLMMAVRELVRKHHRTKLTSVLAAFVVEITAPQRRDQRCLDLAGLGVVGIVAGYLNDRCRVALRTPLEELSKSVVVGRI
jgi:hypothetical protein